MPCWLTTSSVRKKQTNWHGFSAVPRNCRPKRSKAHSSGHDAKWSPPGAPTQWKSPRTWAYRHNTHRGIPTRQARHGAQARQDAPARIPRLDAAIFAADRQPDPIVYIDDISEYNRQEGLALSDDEEQYLRDLAKKLGRPLTDSEVFGFSQVNSEHCRHKIFNGTFIIDGEEKPLSLFKLIKKTSQENPGGLVSAYKDNVAFVNGPTIDLFYPVNPDQPDYFEVTDLKTVLSLKAETHNFPTTVEPFNGAATGSGGEIRDRLGGGKASLPLAGTAVYMTSYPRMSPEHRWELMMNPRVWLYQTPAEILIKASNGASDFGNKFGQPLICGSVLTFEHDENGRFYAYDKVIMLAGGVGFAAKHDAIKGEPKGGEKVVVMGGDNYRIGMGGGAVSSVATGQYDNAIELNAVQRANPEMQKRVSNVIRALAENPKNPIISIHDHGAGGHLNALSELVEANRRKNRHLCPAYRRQHPVIQGNRRQREPGAHGHGHQGERHSPRAPHSRARESPFYVVGETTGDHRFVFEAPDGVKPIDLAMDDMFGKAPKTVMTDHTVERKYADVEYDAAKIAEYTADVLSLEAVACKDWLTNKVDRSITGKVARQQCQGELQLPLSDCGVMALDYNGRAGIATSIGHAPQVSLIDSAKGSVMAVAEALTNIVGTPVKGGLSGISLSANWMWPCKNEGEDAALYRAVEACSDFVCSLGINIPTGKDSLSMTQKYGDDKVYAPGTVIISLLAKSRMCAVHSHLSSKTAPRSCSISTFKQPAPVRRFSSPRHSTVSVPKLRQWPMRHISHPHSMPCRRSSTVGRSLQPTTSLPEVSSPRSSKWFSPTAQAVSTSTSLRCIGPRRRCRKTPVCRKSGTRGAGSRRFADPRNRRADQGRCTLLDHRLSVT